MTIGSLPSCGWSSLLYYNYNVNHISTATATNNNKNTNCNTTHNYIYFVAHLKKRSMFSYGMCYKLKVCIWFNDEKLKSTTTFSTALHFI